MISAVIVLLNSIPIVTFQITPTLTWTNPPWPIFSMERRYLRNNVILMSNQSEKNKHFIKSFQNSMGFIPPSEVSSMEELNKLNTAKDILQNKIIKERQIEQEKILEEALRLEEEKRFAEEEAEYKRIQLEK